jgi:hypothetical protein
MVSIKGIWTIHSLLHEGEYVRSFSMGPDDVIWVGIGKRVVEVTEGVPCVSSQTSRILQIEKDVLKEYLAGEGPYPVEDGYFHDMVCGPGSDLWYFLPNRGFCHFDGEDARLFSFGKDGVPIFGGLPGLAVDGGGALWVSMEETGVCRFQHGVWRTFSRSNDRLIGTVTGIATDHTGHIWIASSSERHVSLLKYDDEMWRERARIAKPDMHEEVKCIAVGNDNVVWIAWGHPDIDSRLGLWAYHLTTERWMKFTKRNSNLPDTDITDIKIDRHNRAWVASGGGITVFKGSESACWIIATPGIVQGPMRRHEAEREATTGDQLKMHFLRGPVYVDSLGQIWVVSTRGLAMFSERSTFDGL